MSARDGPDVWQQVCFSKLEVNVKKFSLFILSASLLMSHATFAGALYGTARIGQAPAANTKISVACPGFDKPGQTSLSTVTDARGSFSLRVQATGRCEMRVEQNNRTGSAFEVFVSNNPLRFDFELDNALKRVR
jgi:hypothetical protein